MEMVLYAILGFIIGFIVGRLLRMLINNKPDQDSSYKYNMYTVYNPYLNHYRKGKK